MVLIRDGRRERQSRDVEIDRLGVAEERESDEDEDREVGMECR